MSVAAAMPTSSRGTNGGIGSGVQAPGTGHHERVLRVRVTGFSRRFAAALIDAVLLASFSIVVTAVTAMALGSPLPRIKEIGPDLLVAGILDRNPMAVGAIGLFLGLTLLYELYCTGMAGQTVGMKMVRIRVIGSRGRPPGAIRGLVRVLAYAVSVLPGALGWLWALFDREHRALHDHLAGTYVILDNS